MTELQQRPQAPDVTKLNLKPVNTQVTNPNQVLSQRPTAPVSPMAPQQNTGAKYQGLFPFDTTGQAIARGQ